MGVPANSMPGTQSMRVEAKTLGIHLVYTYHQPLTVSNEGLFIGISLLKDGNIPKKVIGILGSSKEYLQDLRVFLQENPIVSSNLPPSSRGAKSMVPVNDLSIHHLVKGFIGTPT